MSKHVDFADIVNRELDPKRFVPEVSAPRRPWLQHPPRDLFGLALSGGGIRSATFNLGVLQGLARLKLLDSFDYMATVSGGGYIGAFWSAWRTRHERKKEDGIFPGSSPSGASCDGREGPEVRHLREFSNFLAPKLGLFTLDTGNAVVAVLSSIVPSLLAALSLILLTLYGWLAAAWGLFSTSGTTSLVVLTGFALIVQVVFERVWHKASRAESREMTTYILTVVLASLSTGVVWHLLLQALKPEWAMLEGLTQATDPLESLSWFLRSIIPVFGGWIFAPALTAGAAALVLILFRWITSRWIGQFQSRSQRAALDRALSRTLFLSLAWLVVGALWWAGSLIYDDPRVVLTTLGLTGTSGGAFAWARKLLSHETSKPKVGGVWEMVKPLIPQLLAYMTMGMITVLCAVLVLHAASAWTSWARLVPLGAAAVVTLLTLFLFNPNEVGLHSFYRVRLARTYLGASNETHWKESCNRVTADCEKDDLTLSDLKKGKPFHLICCAANDLMGDHLANLYRGAKSAVLSRDGFSVGDRWVPWGDPEGTKGCTVPTLASAITASGAAFNSHMGSRSMEWGPAVTFLMSAFNLRLGLWLPHPDSWREARQSTRRLVGWPFFKELLGWSQADGHDVHLSDGAHFENLAVYELIRRHCRYILLSDCGADPDVAFDDLANVVRRVREDFGVEVSVDLAPLRPGPNGLAQQPMVAGEVRYPGGDNGILLILKPTLVGDEPVDIVQYKRRNAAFPHETTGDQFYDEAQWESYRRLGEHAALSAFRVPVQLAAQSSSPAHLCAHQVFARARFEWLPVPAASRENFPRLAARVSELEDLLRQAGCKPLLHEVYKEIDELEYQARRVEPEKDSKTPRVSADGSEKPSGGAASQLHLSPEELASSLQILRMAILLMEEVFLAIDLDLHATHPVNLGWINYFARWTYAPLFRMWWPLLKGMYAARFTRFLESYYSLATLEGPSSSVEDLSSRVETGQPPGYASTCWKQRQVPSSPKAPAPTSPVARQFAFRMSMRFGELFVYGVQAALVQITWPKGPRAGAAAWDASWDEADFFVPPGLWGIGIGEAFLSALVPHLREEGVERIVVRFPPREFGRAPANAEGADPTQMYRCAEFVEARRLGDKLIDAATGKDLRIDFDRQSPPGTIWLFRRLALRSAGLRSLPGGPLQEDLPIR